MIHIHVHRDPPLVQPEGRFASQLKLDGRNPDIQPFCTAAIIGAVKERQEVLSVELWTIRPFEFVAVTPSNYTAKFSCR